MGGMDVDINVEVERGVEEGVLQGFEHLSDYE